MNVTNAEQVFADEWVSLDREVGVLNEQIGPTDDSFVGAVVSPDFKVPVIQVYYASDTIPTAIVEAFAKLNATTRYLREPYGQKAYGATAKQINAIFQSTASGPALDNPFTKLQAQGVHVVEFGYHRSRVQYVFTLRQDKPVGVDAARQAISSTLTDAGVPVEVGQVTIATGHPRSDGASRNADPGQMKAGLSISVGACTSNAVMRNGAGAHFLMTAWALSQRCHPGHSSDSQRRSCRYDHELLS